MRTLAGEFRKLLTVPSTWAAAALAFVVSAGMATYLAGSEATSGALAEPTFLVMTAADTMAIVAIFGAVVGVLVVTHEYRYNLLPYTLSATNDRSKVLAAKLAVVTTFAVVVSLGVDLVALVASSLTAHLVHGHELAPQTLGYGDLLWRTVLYGWGYAVAGTAIALLVRNQVGAVVTAFVLFGPVEGILSSALGRYGYLLPFTALANVLGSRLSNEALTSVSHQQAALAFLVDITIAVSVGWLGFLRRDASA
jgi:ABC-type transport system involved in multi-copper enzyme maturation permease subunit